MCWVLWLWNFSLFCLDCWGRVVCFWGWVECRCFCSVFYLVLFGIWWCVICCVVRVWSFFCGFDVVGFLGIFVLGVFFFCWCLRWELVFCWFCEEVCLFCGWVWRWILFLWFVWLWCVLCCWFWCLLIVVVMLGCSFRDCVEWFGRFRWIYWCLFLGLWWSLYVGLFWVVCYCKSWVREMLLVERWGCVWDLWRGWFFWMNFFLWVDDVDCGCSIINFWFRGYW